MANLAAVEGIPQDGPAFLKTLEAYIGHLGTIPDTWRSYTEPYLRISEDANHGWYTEGFDFIANPPHSRTDSCCAFTMSICARNPPIPSAPNCSISAIPGLQAYSIIEGYERIKAGMRLYRAVDTQAPTSLASTYAAISPIFRDLAQVKQMLANDIAFYMGWVGHYAADASQPLHNSIHHDGWSGLDPKGYMRDPMIHGRFGRAMSI